MDVIAAGGEEERQPERLRLGGGGVPESVAVAESAPAPQEQVAEAGTESGAIVESGADPANPPPR